MTEAMKVAWVIGGFSSCAVGLIVWFWQRQHLQKSLARLLEQVKLLAAADQNQQLDVRSAPPPLQPLSDSINALAAERDRMRDDVHKQVAQASQSLQQERNRLAALMSELSQSVLVCNLDGRILLFNNRARLEFKRMAALSSVAGGAEWVGIGRSVYVLLDRASVSHAFEKIRQRLARGAHQPSTHFLTTTPLGQMLRVHMAPVLSGDPTQMGPAELHGFVLTLDNVTQSFEAETRRDQLLLGLAEDSRASLAKVQAALDILAMEGLTLEGRDEHLGQARDEVRAMAHRITTGVAQSTDHLKTRWPMEDMLGTDLLLAAQRHIAAHCGRALHEVVLDTVDPKVWLKVDSLVVLQVMTYLASRMFDEFSLRFVLLRLSQVGDKAHLDLVWSGQAMSTETVMAWELDPMHTGPNPSPLTVRDVMDRHHGVLGFERDRAQHQAFFRLVLPAAVPQEMVLSLIHI